MGRNKGPAWRFFKVENKGVICKYCEKSYLHSNVNKMTEHIIKCLKCPHHLKKCLMVQKVKNSDTISVSVNGLSHSDKEEEAQHCVSTPSSQSKSIAPRNLQSQMKSFVDDMSCNENEALNKALAKAIYVTGTPLSITEHPLWQNFFKSLRPSYILPSRFRLSTSYLDTQYTEMQTDLKEQLTSAKHLHLQCDGWSNIRNESIINFVISKPEPVFIDFLVTRENKHDAPYLSKQMELVMTKHGVEKFFVVIGDNARNMRAAFNLLKEKYPHVVPAGCVAHLLHLLCSDILSCKSVETFMSQASDLVKTVNRSHRLKALFTKIGKEKKVNVSLKLPVKTRWGSNLFCLQSLQANKAVLQTLAVSEETDMTKELKSRLLDDHVFWVRVEKFIHILDPIVHLITKVESNKPLIHTIHYELNTLQEHLTKLLPESPVLKTEERAIISKIQDRKEFALGSIHLAASLLDPQSQGRLLTPEEIIDGMQFVCETGERMGLDVAQVRTDLTNYRNKEGLFGKQFLWESLEKICPLTWWKSLVGTNVLAELSVRILSAPVTSAATERTFSTFSWIHSKKRNRLTSERAAKITFLSYNWKLLNPGNKNPMRTSCDCEQSVLLLNSAMNNELEELGADEAAGVYEYDSHTSESDADEPMPLSVTATEETENDAESE